MAENPQVLLLSSNLRRRYSEDILTALALPKGALIQFRYGAPYVTAELQQGVATEKIIGARAILGFIADFPAASSASVPNVPPFIVPARAARFVYAQTFSDFFIFRLKVEDYLDLSQQTRSEVRERSKAFYDQLVEMNGGYYPAITRFPHIQTGDDSTIDDSRRWLSVVERLAMHDTFADSYFLRIDQPVLPNGRSAEFDSSGRLSLRDGQTAKLSVSFFGARYSDQSKKTLSCSTDGKFLLVSSDDTYDVALRYDAVEFWLQPNTENFDSLARVTVRLGADDTSSQQAGADLTASAHIPVIVKRSRPRLIFKIGVSAAGAFLVAFPAILPPSSSLRLRVLSAVIGAVLLAYAAVMISSGDR